MPDVRSGVIPRVAKVVVDISWWVVGIALAMSLCIWCLAALNVRIGHGHLGIPVAFDVAPSLDETTQGVTIQHAGGTLQIPAERGAFLFGNLTLLVVMLGLTQWVLTQVRAIFATVRDGTPFVRENVRRIRIVGASVIAAQFAVTGMTAMESYYVRAHISLTGIEFRATPGMNPDALIAGLLILAIAEVFKAGIVLQEEQSLTI